MPPSPNMLAFYQTYVRVSSINLRNPLPTGHPFWRLENVLVSPHCADNKAGWLEESMRFFLVNLERFQGGAPLRNVIDKRRGY